MRIRFFRHGLALFGLIGVFLYAAGCSQSPTAPDQNSDNSAVQIASSNSAQIYSTLSSVRQIGDLMQGPQSKLGVDVPGLNNPQQAVRFARQVVRNSFSLAEVNPKVFAKTQGALSDTLVWDITITDTVRGFSARTSLFYDPQTGKGRLFYVRFNFDDRHRLSYDSSEVRLDLNFTLYNDADDVVLSLENLKRYKPGRLLKEESVSVVLDPYEPGTEPQGGVIESNITYSDSSSITSTHSRLEYHEGSGGSWSKQVQYSDGTSSSEAVTFAADGTGTFEEVHRNGTRVSGTFDSADKDGQGSYTKDTTFPPGHDPVSIHEAGQFTQNQSDSTLHGTFEEEVRFKDGSVRRQSVVVDEAISNGIKTTTLTITKSDGSSGKITVVDKPEVDEVSGEWTNTDGTFLVFTAEAYPDGSAHLEFKLYASKAAFENGEDPIASGQFNFFPDGSGQGNVAEGGQEHSVNVESDGTVSEG